MPVPIKFMPYNANEKSNSIDYSFLFAQPPPKKTVTASDKDASLLFALWENSERLEGDTIKIVETKDVTANDIVRLKALGFLTEGKEKQEITFTKRGRMVITTMALGEPNQFANKREKKKYTEILASMSKKGKKGYRMASSDPRFATNSSNNLDLNKLWKSTPK